MYIKEAGRGNGVSARRIATLILTVIFAFGLGAAAVYANDGNTISVAIEGVAVDFDGQGPVIVDDRTLVPVRGVFEQLGFEVDWDGDARQAIL
ncbi:MAG: copper amine oxidase N-terminal domain-containing protein, partial [Clostridiales bacterium]|nr:copper amine oxidase N-terminal domain-containing protein [Clostridiales bacterium]